MMIATGFPAIDPSKRRKKEAVDYRDGPRGGKNAARIVPVKAQDGRAVRRSVDNVRHLRRSLTLET